jgi:hypothetical protein
MTKDEALKLAQPAQEPMETYIHHCRYQPHPNDFGIPKGHWWQAKQYADAVNTTPPAAQRQPLTDEAIWRQYQALWPFHPAEEPRLAADMVTFARAIEAAHGIKDNT